MLIKIISPNLQHHTFIINADPKETVLHLRGQLLHYLYDLGLPRMHFHLHFNGDPLHDCDILETANIDSNSVLTMGSLSRNKQEGISHSNFGTSEYEMECRKSLGLAIDAELDEIKHQQDRMYLFSTLNWIHFLLSFLCCFTVYWYSVFWNVLLFLFVYNYSPRYSRFYGFMGKWAFFFKRFCILFYLFCFLAALSDIIMASYIIHYLNMSQCSSVMQKCGISHFYSAVHYWIHFVLIIAWSSTFTVIFYKLKFKRGDYLAKIHNIDATIAALNSPSYRVRKMAAFDIANYSAHDEDCKFDLVRRDCLPLLMSLLQSTDPSCVEVKLHASDTLKELIKLSTLKSNLLDRGYAPILTRVLCAMTHKQSSLGTADLDHSETLSALVTSLSTVVLNIATGSESNQIVVMAGNGLSELCETATIGRSVPVTSNMANILYQISLNPKPREFMLKKRCQLVEALIALVSNSDHFETKRIALETIHQIASYERDFLIKEGGILHLLLRLPLNTTENSLYEIVGKSLKLYGQNQESAELLVSQPTLVDCLRHFSRSTTATLHKYVANLLLAILKQPINLKKSHIDSSEIKQLFTEIRIHARDTESVSLTQKGLELLQTSKKTLRSHYQ